MSTGFAQPAYHSHFNLANVGSCSALKITSKLYSLLKCQRFEMDHFMRPQNRLHSHASPPPTRLLLATRFSLHSFKGPLHPPTVTMYHPKGLYTVVRCKIFQHYMLCVCLCTLCCIILTEKPAWLNTTFSDLHFGSPLLFD